MEDMIFLEPPSNSLGLQEQSRKLTILVILKASPASGKHSTGPYKGF